MTQTFHAPPVGTVFRDDPYGHALIDRYMPWLLANAFNHDIVVTPSGDSLEGLFSDGRRSNYIENRKWLPWTVLKTNESLSYLFIQDTELPMAVPQIGTVVDTSHLLEQQYPAFVNLLASSEDIMNAYMNAWEVIAHPPNSVVVPFVKPVVEPVEEPVEAETETPEPNEQEAHLFPTLESVDDCLNAIVEKLLSAKKDLIFLTETLGSEKPNLQKPF